MRKLRDKAKNWVAGAFANSKGQLHEATGTPKGKKIPESKLKKAIKGGGVNAKRAQLVENASHFKH